MDVQVQDSAAAAAAAAARWLAAALAEAVAARGRASVALSGGSTPWVMLDALDGEAVPWSALTVYQVDERAVPATDERRNGRRLAERLVRPGRLAVTQFVPMPAAAASLPSAAADYAATLEVALGVPPTLDVVQLGLGADAHTASLIPGDPLLEVSDRSVGVSLPYQGTERLSLTFGVLNAARHRLWLVTGSDKQDALRSLVAGDPHLPCGRVSRDGAVVFADSAAAAGLGR